MTNLAKFNEFSPDGYAAYIRNKNYILETAKDEYTEVIDEITLAVLETIYHLPIWIESLNVVESLIDVAMNLDRKGHLGDFYLICIGYKNFLGDSYLEKFTEFSKNIITLNGFIALVKSGDTALYDCGKELTEWKAKLQSSAIISQEKSTAEGFSSPMVSEMMAAAVRRHYAENIDFFEKEMKFF